MAGNMKDNGRTIRCMDMGIFHGLIKENIKDYMKMIKNLDMANFFGLMADVIKVLKHIN